MEAARDSTAFANATALGLDAIAAAAARTSATPIELSTTIGRTDPFPREVQQAIRIRLRRNDESRHPAQKIP
jgi:hypothetical protein